jgi:hypothetical protein
MKILYETPEGELVATECVTVVAAKHARDDLWSVGAFVPDDNTPFRIADNLTEPEAKAIVRKLFDYGVYMRCP